MRRRRGTAFAPASTEPVFVPAGTWRRQRLPRRALLGLTQRALDGPLLPFLSDLNRIRNEHPALQRLDNITFLETQNEGLIAYAKVEGDDAVIVVCNLDPHNAQEGSVIVPAHLGIPPAFTVRELLAGEEYAWRIGPNYVRLSPDWRQVHVLGVVR